MRACIPDRSDDVLLAGLATGDPQLSLAFVRRFQRTVFGIALGLTRDPGLAEDIAQAAFERAWRSADSYDARRGSVRVWLARITHNLAVDAIRIRRPTPLDLTLDLTEWNPYLVSSTESPEQRALASETSSQLRDALAALPPEQARAVVMAAAHGMTAHEIADLEHIPLGTAKSRIRAAMTKLHGLRGSDDGQRQRGGVYRRGQLGSADQELVHGVRHRPALGDRPHHQRGTPVRVAADEHAGRLGLPVRAAGEAAPGRAV